MKLVPPPMSSRKTFTPGSSSLSLTSVLVLHTSALFCGEMMLGIGPASTAGGHYALGGAKGVPSVSHRPQRVSCLSGRG